MSIISYQINNCTRRAASVVFAAFSQMKLASKEVKLGLGAGAGCRMGAWLAGWLAACLPLIVPDRHAELAANAIYLKVPVNFGRC